MDDAIPELSLRVGRSMDRDLIDDRSAEADTAETRMTASRIKLAATVLVNFAAPSDMGSRLLFR